VIRKAHLQWGIEKGKPLAGSISPLDPADRAASSQSFTKLLYTSSSCPSPTDSTNSTSPLSHNARPGQCFVSHGLARSVPAGCDISVTNTSANPRTKVLSSDRHSGEIDSARANSSHSFSPCLQQIVPNFHDQGVQFYINRYIMGHNDQPHTPTDPRTGWWIWAPPLQDAMAAVGLAGLANLRNSDIQLATSARQRYTAALSRTGRMIQKNDPSESWVTTRLVVLLAMYEVVAKSSTTQSSVNAHFIGAAALMRSFISPDISGSVAFQSMIQLCYASVRSFNDVTSLFKSDVISSSYQLSPVIVHCRPFFSNGWIFAGVSRTPPTLPASSLLLISPFLYSGLPRHTTTVTMINLPRY
jgi:hypothetical protein